MFAKSNNMKLYSIYKKHILKEYSESTIRDLIKKFKSEKKDLSDDEIKNVITRFDQIKSNIPAKIKSGQVTLPKRFTEPDPRTKKISNPQDIFQYTWKDLEALIDAYGSKEIKTSKDFYTVQDAELVKVNDVPIIYNTPELKIYEGSNYPSCIKLNYAFKYKDKNDKIQTYNFCIGRKEDYANRYYSYRFGSGGRGAMYRSFYFVADPTQTADFEGNSDNRENFENWYHFFVIHAFENGKFGVTDATNEYRISSPHELAPDGGVSWEEIGNFMIKNGSESGKKAWDKIKGLKNEFKYVPPSEAETDVALVKDKILNFDAFKNLTRNQKAIYIGKRADQPNAFTPEMFQSLDPELKNLAIRTGRGYKASFEDLKKNPGLLKSYAKYRFSRGIEDIRNNTNTLVLPLFFVQFLDDDEKREYLKAFDDNVTYDLVDKYFGENLTKEFVTKELNQFGADLPPEAKKYMTPEQRDLYDLYSLTHKDIVRIAKSTNERNSTAEQQEISLPHLSRESYLNLKPEERKKLNDLYKKLSGDISNLEKYPNFFMGYPAVLNTNNKRFLVTYKDKPKKSIINPEEYLDRRSLTIMDEDGNIVKDNIDDIRFLKNNREIKANEYAQIYTGSKSLDFQPDDYDTIVVTDVNGNVKKISQDDLEGSLQESLINKYMNRQLKYRANILK